MIRTRTCAAIAGLLVLAGLCGCTTQTGAELTLHVGALEMESTDVPVCATIVLPDNLRDVDESAIAVTLRRQGAAAPPRPGQVLKLDETRAELWWIVPRIRAGEESRWTATFSAGRPAANTGFRWQPAAAGELDLLCDSRRVLRYMHAYDASSPERLHETYKPYHHVFDAAGEHLLTKGPGGLYTHHRGIFIGWNKMKCGEQQYDFWHMKEVTQRHQRFLKQIAGPVLARSKMLIHWMDSNEQPVVAEEREITVFRQSAPTIMLLEFRTGLTAIGGPVLLDGDPEHGGFQYRPHNDVAEGGPDVKTQYVFHAAGIDAHKDENLPWAAESYGLNGRRYSVQHMNHPDNPTPSRYSAYRDYGRFGAFFTKELAAGQTLPLRYRIQVCAGDLPPRETLMARHAAFVNPPRVDVLAGDARE
ncbi:MAG: PmoA family protein [Planctomycetes bacterium]|nr:PmoA family protein [Planctomycetota bacterium]